MLPFKDYVTLSCSGDKHAQTMYIIIPGKEYSNIYLRTDFGRHSMKSNIFHRASRTNLSYMRGGFFGLDTKSWENNSCLSNEVINTIETILFLLT
jgi:hypothetical protein